MSSAPSPVLATVVATDACAWPALTRLPAGVLGIVYFNRPSHGLEPGDLAASISRDEGRSWQPAGLPAPHPPEANRMHIAAGVDHEGRWIVLSTGFRLRDGRFERLEAVWCSVAEHPDGPWSIDRRPAIETAEPFLIPHGRILARPEGSLLATFYRSQGRGKPSRAWLASSRDGGRSWSAVGEIGGGDANECCLLELPDRLLAVVRTHVDHHVVLHQSDRLGHDWRRVLDLTLPMQHPADLIALRDGRLLVTYGIRNRGLMGIGARISGDGGRTWSAPVVLYVFGAASDCGYPSSVECADGEMLTACYSDFSPVHAGYHLLTLRWKLDDWFTPRPLRSISDGAPLRL